MSGIGPVDTPPMVALNIIGNILRPTYNTI